MKEYSVYFTRTITETYNVKANSKKQAKTKAIKREQYFCPDDEESGECIIEVGE
jgi:hypothetical protein